MMRRPRKVYLTTAEAIAWLGIGEKMLRRLASATDWMRPTKFGDSTRWFWLDLVCLAHIVECRKKNSVSLEGPTRAHEGLTEPARKNGQNKG